MFQFKRYIKLLGLCLLTGSFFSCKDNSVFEGPEEPSIPEGMEKITFLLPDYSGESAKFRSAAFDLAQEGYMSNLYVLAVKFVDYQYDASGTKYEVKLEEPIVYPFALNPVGEKFRLSHDSDKNGTYDTFDYRSFNVTLYPGKYRFGLLANVDLYLSRATKISEFSRESELIDIVLNFNESTPLVPTHLPMACMPAEIKYSYTADGDLISVDPVDNLVEITRGNETHIWADMKFLCSKVRYTILFDKTSNGISKAFGNSWIRFNVDDRRKPSATNIRRQTQLFSGQSTGGVNENGANNYDESDPFISHYTSDDGEDHGVWEMNINRYYWPEEGADYPKSPNSQLTLWDKSTTEWIPMEQKVWQGVVYLPENNGSTQKDAAGNPLNYSIAKTLLRFPYHTRENSLDETPEIEASTPKYIYLFGNAGEEYYEGKTDSGNYNDTQTDPFPGLERGYMYDVVAQVIDPDVDEMKVRIFVSVIPWHEITQTIPSEDDLFDNGQGASSNNAKTPIKDWIYESLNSDW